MIQYSQLKRCPIENNLLKSNEVYNIGSKIKMNLISSLIFCIYNIIYNTGII